jgi:hypothetical protein
VRAIAARRGRGVSALLADEIRKLVAEDDNFATARRRARALLDAPLALGASALSREALYERGVFVDANHAAAITHQAIYSRDGVSTRSETSTMDWRHSAS